MALKIAVLKNSLKTSKSPYVVRSDSSEVVEYDQFVELMAGGRTSLSQIEIREPCGSTRRSCRSNSSREGRDPAQVTPAQKERFQGQGDGRTY